MRKADSISGSFWLVISMIMCVESYHAGLGTLRKPGPGFLFFGSGLFLGLMSCIVLLRALRARRLGEHAKPIFRDVNVAKVAFVLIALFSYALLVETLGFVPATFLLFLFLLGVIERKGLIFTGMVSLAVTLASLLLFDTWLRTQLPRGLLEYFPF